MNYIDIYTYINVHINFSILYISFYLSKNYHILMKKIINLDKYSLLFICPLYFFTYFNANFESRYLIVCKIKKL